MNKKKAANVAYKNLPKKVEPLYTKVPAEDLGFNFSTKHLFLSGSSCPADYTLTLQSERSLSLKIVGKGAPNISISPSEVTLSQENPSVKIRVISNTSFNQEVELIHYQKGTQTYAQLDLYVLGSEGVIIRTAGSDEYYQLSHKFSQKRFVNQIEASLDKTEFQVKRTEFLRPTPKKVFKNQQTLTIMEGGEYCYAEYPYWVDVSAGEQHNLACTSDGRLYSWGTGLFGQLGIPFSSLESRQQSVVDARAKKHWQPPEPIQILEKMPENIRDSLEKANREVFAPISPELLQVPMQSNVQSVACGLYHSLVLADGQAFSFGLGENGRLGLGSQVSIETPALVELPERCLLIAAGYHNSFFVGESRMVYSCGACSNGGSGHDSDKLLPAEISFLSEVVQISSGASHSGVVTSKGSAILFGSNEDNRLGGASPHCLTEIEERKIRGIFCGGRHTCALTEDLEVFAWGYNSSGQLGLSSTMYHSMSSPVKVEYLSGRFVVKLALGMEHSCAITADGLLYAWGSNTRGQLAIGTLAKEFNRMGLPRLIDNLLGVPVTSIAASRHGSVLITAEPDNDRDSELFTAWKHNMFGEERHRQELANYRFSLLIRDLKRAQLVSRIQQERDQDFNRIHSPGRHRTLSVSQNSEFYSNVWTSKASQDQEKKVYRFARSIERPCRRRKKKHSVRNSQHEGKSFYFNPRSLLFSPNKVNY